MVVEKLREKISKAAEKAGVHELVSFDITEPPKGTDAEYASNIALVIGNELKKNPREIAESIVGEIKSDDLIAEASVAGPGFINIKLSDEFYRSEIKKIVAENSNYGKDKVGGGKSVNVEYISANPTGPLHIGNARSGPIGEMIANLYENFGYKVEREFYINDIGGQVNRLAETIYYWFEKSNGEDVELPENGYPGEYLKVISDKIFKEQSEQIAAMKNKEEFIEFFKVEGLRKIIEVIKSDVELLNIKFDKWFYQSELENNGESEKVIDGLSEKGFTAKKEGALWFNNPADPELLDKESVLKKSDEAGTLTYFADDIAYHKEKIERGNELCIDVWGSNHHGHIPRLKAALRAIGIPEEKVKVILYQYVRLKNGDEIVKMGKRLGNFVTLRQVIEAGVSADAFKYFVVSQNSNTPIDFDIELAKERSEKNPVFYIEYAHARICSILRKVKEEDQSIDGEGNEGTGESNADLTLLKETSEKNLMHELAKYPDRLRFWNGIPRPIDVRYVGESGWVAPGDRRAAPRQRTWLRIDGKLPDDPLLHACALTYASDLTLLDSVLSVHGEVWGPGGVVGASLDHAVWFHRPFRADEWFLYDCTSPSASGARGLATGRMLTLGGRHIATAVQEGLLRKTGD